MLLTSDLPLGKLKAGKCDFHESLTVARAAAAVATTTTKPTLIMFDDEQNKRCGTDR